MLFSPFHGHVPREGVGIKKSNCNRALLTVQDIYLVIPTCSYTEE